MALLAFLLWAFAAATAQAKGLPVQEVASPGGIKAWLIEDHSTPLIAVSVGFHGGAASDPAGKSGVAEFVSGMLDEGAGPLDSAAFQQRLADLGAELSFDASQDDFTGTMRMLTAHRDDSFDLLRLSLTAPRFDAEPVERIRGQLLAQVARHRDDPDDIAGRTWRAVVFGDHPYARDSRGTAESVAAITADDLRRFVADRFARDNLHIGVVGDITASELGPLLDRTFGALPATAAPLTVPDAAVNANGQLIVVEKDIPQSVVVFGHEGIARHAPDFYAAYVVNHILGGGGFSSRLTEEVREKRGLAYGIDTYLATYDHAALIAGGVGTQNARVAESLSILRQEWARMRDEGPTEAELADAKTYLIGSYPLRFTTSTATSRALVAVQLEDFPVDYFAKRNGYIRAVTLEDARRVAKRLLDPDKLAVVVVGKPEGVRPTQPAPGG
ncbi:MAG: insulinase family protein [Rhodospirillaceae bacterium]|nr:insulinase family protein [Rhodospirillaceae bacterium]